MEFIQDVPKRSASASVWVPFIGAFIVAGFVSFHFMHHAQPSQLQLTKGHHLRHLRTAVVASSVLSGVPASAPSAMASHLPLEHASFITLVAEDPALSLGDYAQLGFLVLLLPIAGYASWTFGLQKSRESALKSKEGFEKALKEGTAVKFSPSGVATIMGFPLASDQGWQILSKQLRERGIKSVSGQELTKLANTGVTIVDVRSSDRFATSSIPGSINIPLFQPITGWTPFKIARRVQFGFFGIPGTECNPNFVAELQSKLSTTTNELIFLDDSVRGTLEPTFAFPEGKPGHALMSIYIASELAKLKNPMRYVEGGINSYSAAGGETLLSAQ